MKFSSDYIKSKFGIGIVLDNLQGDARFVSFIIIKHYIFRIEHMFWNYYTDYNKCFKISPFDYRLRW